MKWKIDYYYTDLSGQDKYELYRNKGIIFDDWCSVKTCNSVQEAREFLATIKDLPEYC